MKKKKKRKRKVKWCCYEIFIFQILEIKKPKKKKIVPKNVVERERERERERESIDSQIYILFLMCFIMLL